MLSKWAAQVSFASVRALLQEVLPIEHGLHEETIRQHVLATAERLQCARYSGSKAQTCALLRGPALGRPRGHLWLVHVDDAGHERMHGAVVGVVAFL